MNSKRELLKFRIFSLQVQKRNYNYCLFLKFIIFIYLKYIYINYNRCKLSNFIKKNKIKDLRFNPYLHQKSIVVKFGNKEHNHKEQVETLSLSLSLSLYIYIYIYIKKKGYGTPPSKRKKEKRKEYLYTF